MHRPVRTVGLVLLSALLGGCGGSSLDAGLAVPANAAVRGEGSPALGQVGGPSATPSGPAPQRPGSRPDTRTPVDPASADPGAPTVPDPVPATGGDPTARASCAGFRTQTGVTDSTITLATVADISGPIPGIFSSATLAVRAYAAYFNATSTLCGRKLEVLALDSRTDSLGDQLGYERACASAFAAVGSMAAFDSGGAATADRCGLPDLRSQSVSDQRNACRTCFGVQATELHAFQNAVPDFFVQRMRAATQHAAMIYVNAPASVDNATNMMAAEERRGMRFVYSSAFDVAEFNYAPYVLRMKKAGVRWVQFVGSADQAVRLARAMEGAGFRPEAFVLDPTAYTPEFAHAGAAVDGAYVFVNFTPLEEAAGNAELRLYEQWLRQVSPDAVPTYFGMYSWSAARLFVEQATALGGGLTRAALVSRLRSVHGWTGRGLHAAQDVGGKTNGNCWRFLQLRDGVWRPVGGSAYLCHGATRIR